MSLAKELNKQGNLLFKHRGTLPLIILSLALLIFILKLKGPNAFMTHHYYALSCLFVALFGQFIRLITVGYTADLTSGRNTEEQLANVLNTKGIYSIVRHPLYLGNFFMWLGLCLLIQDLWFTISFILIYWIYYERIMFAEEAFLINKFGDTYLDWASSRPAFWPNFAIWKSANSNFNWKKILLNEKNGIVALFSLFWLFNFIEIGITTSNWSLKPNLWLYSMIISIIYYALMKILMKMKLV
ncbi:MAG: lipid A phosphate methyltransferase [Flammeovirgaceae bacterium]|nr:lipid A phosphate methyltransferase [Flammeovirgaceae bacterium]